MMKRLLVPFLVMLAAAPAAAQLRPGAYTTLRTTDTGVNSLVVGGATGATVGTGTVKAGAVSVNGVGIIGTDGRIPAISSTYFASLSGATLTGIVETAITDGALLARVADNETVSGQWTFTGVTQTLSSANPVLLLKETDAAADNQVWRHIVNGTGYNFQISNDAGSVNTNVLTFARSGTTAGAMTVGASTSIFPAGSAVTPSIALTEAVGAANNDSGMYWAAGSVNLGVNGSQIAQFNNSAVTLGASTSVNVFNGTLTVGGTAGVIGLAVGGLSNTPLSLNRTTSDGFMIDVQRDGSSVGSVSVAAGVVAYNTFMGAHYTQLRPGQDEPEQGLVMVTTGEQIPMKPRKLTRGFVQTAPGETAWVDDAVEARDPAAERFVYTALSSRRNQRGVYGVWHADLGRTAAGMSWGDPDAEVYQIGALGLTTVWVTDTCGNIEKGMLLSTSPLQGLAERQCAAGMAKGSTLYDPVQRDYTLGKALVDVNWSTVLPDEDGVRRVRIPAVLFAG